MKSAKSHIFKTIAEAVNVVTSKEGLIQLFRVPLYGNAFYLMLNTAIMSFLGFFFWMVAARFYTEAEVGFSSAIISAISLLTMLSLVGLNISLIRFLPHTKRPQNLINACFTLSGLISLVVAGIFVAGLGFWSPALAFVKQNAIFASAFAAFTLAWTLSSMIDATFIARRSAKFVVFKNTILSLLKILLLIILVLFFHTFGIVASWGVAVGIALAISLLLFLPRVQNPYKPVPTLQPSLIKGMWRYSSANYLANLLSGAPSLILPLMVVNFLGAESNAYFYIAWMMAALLSAIPGGVSESLFAEGSHFEEKLKENVMKSLKFTFLLLIPAVVLMILVGKWLLLAFGQSYSANALNLLWVLCLSSLPLGINHIYSSILRVTNKIKELIVIWGFIAVAVLLASYVIMPSTGIMGIGYAWLAAQVAVAAYILSTRRLI